MGWTRERPDAGESLIEILISILLLGVSVAAVLAALANGSNMSAVHRSDTTADVVLRSYAEAVKAAPYSPFATGYPPLVAAVHGFVAVSGYTVTASVSCGVPAGLDSSIDASEFRACTAADDLAKTLQRVDLEVTYSAGTKQRVTVFKRGA